jgi:type IV pilus assembly protein PilC
MDYRYVVYTGDNKLVKGKLSAPTEEAATDMLTFSGYRVITLKEVTPFFPIEKITARFVRINPNEVIMFSRQLALLIESGTDVVTALELLQRQVTNRSFRRIIGEVVADIRAGMPLSQALKKHPRAFSPVYHRLVAIGERTGNLEVVLRRAADYMERIATTQKNVRNALVYPAIVFVVAIMVIAVLVVFVFPAFAGLYSSFGAELPAITRAFIAVTGWLQNYGLYLLLAIVAVVVVGYIYTRTPRGRYQWGKLMLTMPRIGRINLLNELSRCCRSIALLFGSGLPLPEIMTLTSESTNNKAMEEALTDVKQSMIAGEGLSAPMARNELFLPLMVQMTAVGEETGNLDDTLSTVAEAYETEADDKTNAMVSLITPAMTIFIGLIVGLVALSLLSAMYSIYGQV